MRRSDAGGCARRRRTSAPVDVEDRSSRVAVRGAVASAGHEPDGVDAGARRGGGAARSRRTAATSPRPDRPRRCSRSSRPSRWASATATTDGRVEPPVVEAVRQHQHVGREPVAADVRDLPGQVGVRGGQRRGDRAAALGAAGVVPAVRAHGEHRVGVRRQPRRAAGARAPRRRGRAPRGCRRARWSPATARAWWAYAANTRSPCRGSPAGRAAGSAAPAPRSPPPGRSARRRGRRAAGRRAARSRPRVRGSPAAGTRAPSRRCRPSARPAARLAAAQRNARSRQDLEQPLPHQPPTQHQPALLVQRQVRGVQLAAGSGPPRAPGAARPGRSSERSPRSTSSRLPAVEQHARVAGPAPQQGVVGRASPRAIDVAQPAGQPRRPLGEEAAYLVLHRDGRVDAAQLGRPRRARCRPSWWASACGSSR